MSDLENILVYDYVAMQHNYGLVKQAEQLMNNFLENDSNSISGICLINPDGTKVKIQPGFKLVSYEIVG